MSCGCPTDKNFCVPAGATFQPTLRWALESLVSKPVTGISQAVPALVTAVGHGMPDGWPCCVVAAKGMFAINATSYPPAPSDWHESAVLGLDTVALLDVNSADMMAYTSGGYLVYPTPADLTGVAVDMAFYAEADRDGTPLLTLHSPDDIAIDLIKSTITPQLQTGALPWKLAYYTLLATDGEGVRTELLRGTVTIE